jgi:integrase
VNAIACQPFGGIGENVFIGQPAPTLAILPKPSGPTVASVVEECCAAKKVANRRPHYTRALRGTLIAFARGRESQSIDSFTLESVEEWLNRRPAAGSTKRGEATRLSTLFAFAMRRGYRPDNPCVRLETIAVDQKPPRIFSPYEAEMILRYCKKSLPWRLPQIVLGLFGGVRPSELQRLRWRDVNLDTGVAVVDSAASKVRARRIVPLSPNAVAWLKTCVPHGKPLGAIGYKWIHSIERNLAIEWHNDILRHSAGSYLLSKFEDVGKVARWLGNSPAVLLRFYTELVNKEDCERYWSIVP